MALTDFYVSPPAELQTEIKKILREYHCFVNIQLCHITVEFMEDQWWGDKQLRISFLTDHIEIYIRSIKLLKGWQYCNPMNTTQLKREVYYADPEFFNIIREAAISQNWS